MTKHGHSGHRWHGPLGSQLGFQHLLSCVTTKLSLSVDCECHQLISVLSLVPFHSHFDKPQVLMICHGFLSIFFMMAFQEQHNIPFSLSNSFFGFSNVLGPFGNIRMCTAFSVMHSWPIVCQGMTDGQLIALLQHSIPCLCVLQISAAFEIGHCLVCLHLVQMTQVAVAECVLIKLRSHVLDDSGSLQTAWTFLLMDPNNSNQVQSLWHANQLLIIVAFDTTSKSMLWFSFACWHFVFTLPSIVVVQRLLVCLHPFTLENLWACLGTTPFSTMPSTPDSPRRKLHLSLCKDSQQQ